jgi:hypothetical protein
MIPGLFSSYIHIYSNASLLLSPNRPGADSKFLSWIAAVTEVLDCNLPFWWAQPDAE